MSLHSKNEYALKSSLSQLKGSVKRKIEEMRKEIIYHTAFIETALDDPEHISVDGYGENLKKVSEEIKIELEKLIDSSDNGRIMTRRNPDGYCRKAKCRKIFTFECTFRQRTRDCNRY